MNLAFVALEPQNGDDKPVLIGQLPKAGTYGLAIQFAKYQQTDADQKMCSKYFDFCDGDAARPLYISNGIKAKDIRQIVNKLGNRVRVIDVVSEQNPEVFVKASSKMEYRFYQAWLQQIMDGAA